MESGYFKTHFFDNVCEPVGNNAESNNLCGSDDLAWGKITVRKSGKHRQLFASIAGVKPWHLYSIYYLPIGANPCSEKIFVGEVLSNYNGEVHKIIRNCGKNPWPTCLNNWGQGECVDPYKLEENP